MGFLFDQALFYPALKENKTNMTSSEQIKACERKVKYLYKKRDKIYASNLEKMKEYGVEIVGYDDIKDKEDKKFLEHYFTISSAKINLPGLLGKAINLSSKAAEHETIPIFLLPFLLSNCVTI